ncbi:lysophospholipid acyltransferase family protein [Bdellovibrionota bacterium FG-1]
MIRTLVAWLYSAIYWAAVLSLHILCLKRLPPQWIAKAAHFWGRSTFWLLGIRLEVLNPCPFLDQQARVVVVNHQSGMDLVWGAIFCPPAPLVIGKKEVLFIPIINMIWWGLDFICIDRANHQKALAALKGVGHLITSERRSLVVAPEGTRTRDGSIGPFKKGAFHIAKQAQVPLYPLVVSGVFELMPKGSFLAKKGTIYAKFLDPILPADFGDDLGALTDRVRQRMIETLAELSLGTSPHDAT